MTDRADQIAVLTRGLDQARSLLVDVSADRLGDPTPCRDWTVSDLADHMVGALPNFARMVRGQDVDWSQPTPHVDSGWAETFAGGADDLLAAWAEAGDDAVAAEPDWQSAEIAVHSYDLATALGRPTSDLDPEVAERGLAFMQGALKPEMRGEAFEPEQPAPAEADAYQRIAAFAGRTV